MMTKHFGFFFAALFATGIASALPVNHPALNVGWSQVPTFKGSCVIEANDKAIPPRSWESIIECVTQENYYNDWCDDFTKDMRCSDASVEYTIVSTDGAKSKIACTVKGGRRVIQFPAGRFPMNEQVWVPPHTTVLGINSPNVFTQGDGFTTSFQPTQNSPDKQTYFIAEVDTYTISGGNHPNYCKPEDPSKTPEELKWMAKHYRKGFNMHDNTELGKVVVLGNDRERAPCSIGGGAIETPGCISSYGGGTHDLSGAWREPGCYPDDQSGAPVWGTNFGKEWVTGGYKTYQSTSNVHIHNIRVDDPGLRTREEAGPYKDCSGGIGHNFDMYDPMYPNDPKVAWNCAKLWPASQHTILTTPSPDASKYSLSHFKIENVVSLTSIADGVNLHSAMDNVTISNMYLQNTGDDAFAVWPGPVELTNVALKDLTVYNPGVRGVNGPYSWGSCFAAFGVQSITFDRFKCYDRYCPVEEDASKDYPMCQDWANGHMFVLNAPVPDQFDGRYGDGSKITINNPEWYNVDGDPIPSTDPLGYWDTGTSKWTTAAQSPRSTISRRDKQYYAWELIKPPTIYYNMQKKTIEELEKNPPNKP